jgi:phosphoribosylformylglycinamidine synthase I
MKTAIIIFPGTNREHDMAAALKTASGVQPDFIWHKQTDLPSYDLIVLPGGFSYGDYLRCGAMAAHSPVMQEVIRHAARGTRILGVCNGFQMLVETRLLPGALLHNQSLKFLCKNVSLRCETDKSDFTAAMPKGHVMHVPIAHGEGNYFVPPQTLQQLEDEDRIAFRYCNENGEIVQECNPNGSISNIAGVLSADRRILGMMPHPENATQEWQLNQSGLGLFTSIIQSLA